MQFWRATFINQYNQIQCLYIETDTEAKAIELCYSTPLAANPKWRCIKGEPILFGQLPDCIKRDYKKRGKHNE